MNNTTFHHPVLKKDKGAGIYAELCRESVRRPERFADPVLDSLDDGQMVITLRTDTRSLACRIILAHRLDDDRERVSLTWYSRTHGGPHPTLASISRARDDHDKIALSVSLMADVLENLGINCEGMIWNDLPKTDR